MTQAITEAGGRSGAEEILARILENARQAGEKLLAAAAEKQEKILTEAELQADLIRRKTAEAYAAKAEATLHAATSAAELETRNRLLQERRSILDETLEKTVAHLRELPDAAYFDALLSLAARSAQSGEGILLLGDKDLKRLPGDFEIRLNGMLEAGKGLTVSREAVPVDGGFLLKYGDIEMNCSFSALLDARREELEDLVNRILFGA